MLGSDRFRNGRGKEIKKHMRINVDSVWRLRHTRRRGSGTQRELRDVPEPEFIEEIFASYQTLGLQKYIKGKVCRRCICSDSR